MSSRILIYLCLSLSVVLPNCAWGLSRCESAFRAVPVDLLAKAGLQANEIRFITYHRKENRVWIELRKTNQSRIGRMGLWPGAKKYIHIEIVLLDPGYEGQGLGFLMYAVAAQVAANNYNRVLSTQRDRHTDAAEKLWSKMVTSGAAKIRYLPLHELVEYLNAVSVEPMTSEAIANYIDRFGQTIYVMNQDADVARAVKALYAARSLELIVND